MLIDESKHTKSALDDDERDRGDPPNSSIDDGSFWRSTVAIGNRG